MEIIMPSRPVFNESVFNSYSNLKNFFKQSDAIDQVLSKKNKSYSKPLIPFKPNLACRWQVCQVATAPFRYISAFVLIILSKISSFAGAKAFAKWTKNSARYQIAGFNVYSEEPTKLFKITHAENDPNTEGKIVNETATIPVNRIIDPRVKNRTFCSIREGVRFGHHQGICRGMSNWFVYLYLNTKDQFADPRSHMSALGKLFQDGGGSEATLLQSLYIKKGSLLGLKVGIQPIHSHGTLSTPVLKQATSDWNSSMNPQVATKLQNLPAGVYRTNVPRHAMAYIKINDTLSYFFDPNEGLIEINGKDQGEKLYELLKTSLDKTGGAISGCPTANFIEAYPVTLR